MKLSIITVNLNNAEGLRKTIESVVVQTFTDYEYIIIDGGSTDSSVEIIKQYANAPLSCGEGLGERLYWVSEPDKGIYNAMNKGILQAKGEYCLFLNSGDWLIDSSVFSFVFEINHYAEDILFGDLMIIESARKWVKKYDDKINLKYFCYHTLPHQGSFINKKLFDNCCYDETLTLVADWAFFVQKIINEGATYKYLNKIISAYPLDGVSANQKNFNEMYCQKKRFLNEHYPPYYFDLLEEWNIANQENHILKSQLNHWPLPLLFSLKRKLFK